MKRVGYSTIIRFVVNVAITEKEYPIATSGYNPFDPRLASQAWDILNEMDKPTAERLRNAIHVKGVSGNSEENIRTIADCILAFIEFGERLDGISRRVAGLEDMCH